MTVHTPHGVVLAALMQPVPCPRCSSVAPCRCIVDPGERLEWQATLVVKALQEHNLLTTLQSSAREQNVEEVARWLAEQSRHPRYVHPGGWQKLLESEADITVAHRAARDTHGGDRDLERAFAVARDELLRHVASRRAVGTVG